MRIGAVGINTYLPLLHSSTAPKTAQISPVISKETMLQLLNLTVYNQTGMAFKLARVAAQMYAGMNFDVQA